MCIRLSVCVIVCVVGGRGGVPTHTTKQFLDISRVSENYHKWGGINRRNVFLTILQAVESKIKGLANSVSGKGHFLVHRPPFSPTVTSHSIRGQGSSLTSFIRELMT